MKKKFLINNEDNKVCPDCGKIIKEKWTSCYILEWCPYCGCNIEECKKNGELK